MKKLIKSIVCVLLIVSCSKAKSELSSEPISKSEDTTAVEANYDDWLKERNKVDSVAVVDSVSTKEFEKNKCFNNDNDVLEYLNGKTFFNSAGNLQSYLTFSSDGVIQKYWYKKVSTERYKGDYNDELRYQYWGYKEIKYKYISYYSKSDGKEGMIEYSDISNDENPFKFSFNCEENILFSPSGVNYELGVLEEYKGDGIH